MTSHNIDLLKKFFNDKFKNNDFFTNVIFYSHGSDEFNIQFFYNKSLNLNSIKAYIKKLSFILFQDHKFDLVVHKQLGFEKKFRTKFIIQGAINKSSSICASNPWASTKIIEKIGAFALLLAPVQSQAFG